MVIKVKKKKKEEKKSKNMTSQKEQNIRPEEHHSFTSFSANPSLDPNSHVSAVSMRPTVKYSDLLLFLDISVKLCCSFFSYHQKCPL